MEKRGFFVLFLLLNVVLKNQRTYAKKIETVAAAFMVILSFCWLGMEWSENGKVKVFLVWV